MCVCVCVCEHKLNISSTNELLRSKTPKLTPSAVRQLILAFGFTNSTYDNSAHIRHYLVA